MLINSSNRCSYSNREVFDTYLTEMHKLETQVLNFYVGISYKVYVVLVLVTGDYLGINVILGYTESFTARFPCPVLFLHPQHPQLVDRQNSAVQNCADKISPTKERRQNGADKNALT
jgi:hypothetical protein